jgi:hypothetical protein
MQRAAPRDLDRMRMVLRKRVQDYVDKVFEFADQAN